MMGGCTPAHFTLEMKMKNILIILLLLIKSVGLVSQEYYPRWFIYPSEYPNTVIGFSYMGLPASDDAEQMYWIYKECIVKGKLLRYSDYDEKVSDYYYYFPYDSLEIIKGKLILKDQFITCIVPQDYIAIFSLDSLVEIEADPVNISSIKTPDWTQNIFWESGGYYYATGYYDAALNINDAWKTAEEHAYFEIMNAVAIKIYSVQIFSSSNQQDDYESAIAVELTFKLKHLEVVERWPDKNNNMFYVLARIKTDNVYSPMLNKSQ
ncbi:MAG: hypothetical protein KJ771_09025 [Nanoarchaeota archaeon]|nr:hypothetical protein [Nanoarchaeota archaeon]